MHERALAGNVGYFRSEEKVMSSNFPSRTVTFLFTDIENSTKLWEQHPQEMLVAHARHSAHFL